MLWLAEGLTSFMDDLFILRAGLCSLEEYLTIQKGYFEKYYQSEGRHIQSLEESSFDAWIKLYRQEENTRNSTVSYYLKGGLVFSVLNCLLLPYQHCIDDVILGLWQLWCERPEQGLTTEEVLTLIESLSSASVRQQFQQLLSSTEEIDFAAYYQEIGLQFVWETDKAIDLGVQWEMNKHRLMIKSVRRESVANRQGLCAGDELLAINHTRIYPEEQDKLNQWLCPQQHYLFLVARLGQLVELSIVTDALPAKLQQLHSCDHELTLRALKVNL
jgi:predicted metalloprotease with PDZ domain